MAGLGTLRNKFNNVHNKMKHVYSQSFLTNDRREDSKATPPNTTSFFPPPREETGLPTAGVAGLTVEGPGSGVLATVVVVVEDEATLDGGLEDVSTFKPGRIYLFEGL